MRYLKELFLFFLTLVLIIAIFSFAATSVGYDPIDMQETPVSNPVSVLEEVSIWQDVTITVPLYQKREISLRDIDLNLNSLPSFASIEDTVLVLEPTQFQDPIEITGQVQNQDFTITINVGRSHLNTQKIESEVLEYLTTRNDHYGIYVYDISRGESFEYNANQEFPPGSISKLPGVVLALIDIQNGLYSFEDTYPIQDRYKHSDFDSLGMLPAGTPVTLKEYIDKNIYESNNTAQYHLRGFLGGSFEEINPRTVEELGIHPFFENPFVATPKAVGDFLTNIYKEKYLNEEYTNYFINLMQQAYPDLRLGIPEGLKDYNVTVANKVGFTFGPNQTSTYADSAIVFGEHSDYIIVILNDEAPLHPYGRFVIQDLAKIIHSNIDVY